MSGDVCSVPECGRPTLCRGWCGKHYARWSRHGDPTVTVGPSPDDSPLDRVLSRCVATLAGCIEFHGDDYHPKGYGRIGVEGRSVGVHRLAYEAACGPIGDDRQIDHLCRNPRCVNPAHLEAVTPAENNRRSLSPTAKNERKTFCDAGHPLAGANLYLTPEGRRQCRECRRRRNRESQRRRRLREVNA